jgi:hypothetical protein
MAKLLPVDDIMATINHLHSNWQSIKQAYQPDGPKNYLSPEVMLELLMKL